MVAKYSIPDIQSIIHAVLTRNSRAMCDKHEERLVSIVYLVCLVCWLNQIDQIDQMNQMNQMNLPQSCPSRLNQARKIAVQSFTTIQQIAAMASNRSTTVPAMMQTT